MTDHPPTMTHAELTDLEASLRRLSQLIFDSPVWGDSTALGILAESDDDTITAAAKIVHRLSLDAKYTRTSDTCYLPVPTLAPVPAHRLRCPDCGGATLDHGDALSRICANDDCPRVFVNVSDLSSIRAVQS